VLRQWSAKKRGNDDDDKKDNNNASFNNWKKSCGNNAIEVEEECDEDTKDDDDKHICDRKTCYCKPGFYLKNKKCKPLCGNGRWDRGEECDDTEGCDKKCKCKKDWEPYVGPHADVNGTFVESFSNSSVCRLRNKCLDNDYCEDDMKTCVWDGKEAQCNCDPDTMKTVTYWHKKKEEMRTRCQYKNPCTTKLNKCKIPVTCVPDVDDGEYTGDIICPEWN